MPKETTPKKNSGVTLPTQLWEIARAIGHGNTSLGIRIALTEYANTHDLKPFEIPQLGPKDE